MGVAPRPGPVLGSYASRSQTSSSAILHAAIMIRPLLSIGALVVLAAVAESASITDLFASYGKSANSYADVSYGKSTSSSGEDSYNEQEHYKEDSYKKDGNYEKDDHHEKDYHHKDIYKQESREDIKYDHDNKRKKQVSNDRNYKHEPQYYEKAYYRPIYEVHEEPMYRSKTMKPHKMYESSYRHKSKSKRSAGLITREQRVLARWEAVFGSRHAQSDCKCSAACLNVIPAFHRILPAFSGL